MGNTGEIPPVAIYISFSDALGSTRYEWRGSSSDWTRRSQVWPRSTGTAT